MLKGLESIFLATMVGVLLPVGCCIGAAISASCGIVLLFAIYCVYGIFSNVWKGCVNFQTYCMLGGKVAALLVANYSCCSKIELRIRRDQFVKSQPCVYNWRKNPCGIWCPDFVAKQNEWGIARSPCSVCWEC
ncbi:hypothetical protein HPP92_006977 [Vanilla planifolia]|uniref:Uncharacterized protein n=1 Tax=Vanilla planifolia TaxID=51239 RepID=A0A835RFE1_VANPL|nr:hypothetical protein HPP92_007218 [Vanilla planifolia]KAG0490114.1 hypothetical protein HPP92_006977 [Vanilla planifolia]